MNKLSIAGLIGLAALAMAGAAHAADDCAVSGLNGKAQASATSVDTGPSKTYYDASLVGSVPLGCRFGAQAEVSQVWGNGADRTFAAGHLFARDPSKYLVGVTGGWVDGGAGSNLSFLAAEGEYYTDHWTVSATAGGVQYGSATNKDLYGLTVAYYPTDNLKVSLNDTHAFGEDLARARVEWQPANSPFSLFADVSDDVGAAKFTTVRLGGRVYFGGKGRTLKDRDRHDDPDVFVTSFGTWYNITAAQANTIGTGGGLPTPVNGVCPPGFFYVPTLDPNRCYI